MDDFTFAAMMTRRSLHHRSTDLRPHSIIQRHPTRGPRRQRLRANFGFHLRAKALATLVALPVTVLDDVVRTHGAPCFLKRCEHRAFVRLGGRTPVPRLVVHMLENDLVLGDRSGDVHR